MREADILRGALVPVMLVATFVIWRSRRFVVGRLFLLVGALHLSGLWVARDAVASIVAEGFVGGEVVILVD